VASPRDTLARDHEDALSLLKRLGVDRTRRILARAQQDLERRLDQAVKGPGADSFTAAQARTALQQVREATRVVQRGVRDVLLDGAGVAAEHAGENLERYLESANRAFAGVSRPLGLDLAAMVDAASSGVKATVLRRLASSGEPVEGADEEPHRAKQGILERYGLETVGHFEEIMQRGLVTRAPWQDVRAEITAASPFLQAAPAHWAERIVRTECLIGSTPVSGAVVRAAHRRWYEGDVIEIRTEHGRHLTTTPNHPMLTRRGWVASGILKTGDDLVCNRRQENAGASGHDDVPRTPPTIGEVFDALSAIGVFDRRRCSKPDFHGDGRDGEVDVLHANGELKLGSFAALYEPIAKDVFTEPDLPGSCFCARCGHLLTVDKRPCFCDGSDGNTFPDQSLLERTCRQADRSDERLDPFAGRVAFRDHVRRDVFAEPRVISSLQSKGERFGTTSRNAGLPDDSTNVRGINSQDGADLHAARSRQVHADDRIPVVFAQKQGSVLSRPRRSRREDDVLDPPVAETYYSGDFPRAEARDVEFDRVASIIVRRFSGHVFNLTTWHGYFCIDGVYTGNTHGIYNRAGWESIREADEQLGDMLKILSATFDDRTGADSYAVHGQIRRPEESFQSWFGLYQHPPNRPNDREVVVPHRMSWPIPPYLAWRSDAQVLARWHYDGRKGSPPPRPLMTTVPLEKIGIAHPAEDAASTAPTIVPPPGPAIPPERFAFRPAPPMPAIKRNEFAAPTPERIAERRAQIDKMAARDAKLFPAEPWTGDPLDDPSEALDLKARKRMKRAKKGDDRKYNIELPFDFVNDTTNVDSPQYAAGLGGRRSEQLAHAKPEKIAIEDVVARGGEYQTANRRNVEYLVTHLVNNRGRFVAGEEDETNEYRKPLVIRYGERLYPYSPYELDKFAAAKLVGMKTLDVHVVDLNPHLAAKAREENEKIDQRIASRQRIVDREAKRAKAAVEERVKLEHEGDPDVVAVRIKHQPYEYEKEYLPKYGEAAASIGWGRAMMERGLDMPNHAMVEIAKRFDDKEHPLWGASSIVRNMLKEGGTLRDALNGPDVTDRKRAIVKKWAATFAHVDAIVPHEAISMGTHDDNIGARDATKKKIDMLAGLTDRSVSVPTVVHVGSAPDGRAFCETGSVVKWGGKEVIIALKRDEQTDVVFHELGHAIEATDRGRGMRASAFLDARTAGEDAKPMNHHVEGGYADDEVARKDAFEHPYVGKDYGREEESTGAIYTDPYFGEKEERGSLPETKRVHSATEVTSMAIQRLGDDSGAWSHFEQDPEHFLFGLGQLGGY